ncbi:hypothetical protein M378DRAFT_158873 [Amanita muscaria Koide BX008]|uniref:Uncharacterized protein n=1 Tax=Amanita muscaria (strain Koide BX008) TaxID=946122 RepID=A0A0C2XHA6_AMAMK|nr:hypothetical protein M378DRAFT_158873 [Amanita muscaria Koide BX008]
MTMTRQHAPILMVLFEPDLGSLKMPILKAPVTINGNGDVNESRSSQQFPLELFVRKYFQWVCTFDKDGR